MTNSTILIFILLLITGNVFAKSEKIEVFFSQERGYYKNSFLLRISSNNSKAFIKYTLNCSDPKNSKTALNSKKEVQLQIDPNSKENRGITPAVVVSACAIYNGDTSEVITNTYIFTDYTAFQTDINPDLGEGWPNIKKIPQKMPEGILDWMWSDYQTIDLGIDPEIAGSFRYKNDLIKALQALPVISLVTSPDNLFDTAKGIYVNAVWHGTGWERPASVEFMENTSSNIQINAGLRIRGGFSRNGGNPKHAFRLFFKKEYGAGKLKFPLFYDEGADEFDKIDLRCDQNDGWNLGGSGSLMLRDLFSRDSQKDMEKTYTRSRFYHLYLNGMYWGLYQTQERPEASFAASYLGGKKEDYDIIKSTGPSYDAPPYTLEATDGDLLDCETLWKIATEGFSNDANYYKVLGKNPDGSRNPAFKILVDEENLIDYMLITYYTGDTDGPDANQNRINNFFGIYNRVQSDGFKFIRHDAENSMYAISTNNTNNTITGSSLSTFNPKWLHERMLQNPRYLNKFKDRAYEVFFNNGLLTPNVNIERLMKRAKEIDLAIIGESARWGDVNSSSPYTRDKEWISTLEDFKNKYLTIRTDTIIKQFERKGWLDKIKPPIMEQTGSKLVLKNQNSGGEIFYTVNGQEPINYGKTFSISDTLSVENFTALRARVKLNNQWSQLLKKDICGNATNNNLLKITEIQYHPRGFISGNDTITEDKLEFVELKNIGQDTIYLGGMKFTKGVKFQFAYNDKIAPGAFYIIASDSICFRKKYTFSPHGQYSGKLNNSGDQLLLLDCSGEVAINCSYQDNLSWFKESDGIGFSIVASAPNNPDPIYYNTSWRSSTNEGGSPGKDDPQKDIFEKVTIAKLITNAPIQKVELYNPSDMDVNIGGWYLTNSKNLDSMWRIPDSTILKSKSSLGFYSGHLDGNQIICGSKDFGNKIKLSPFGEILYLFASKDNKISSLVDALEFEPTDENKAFGRFKNNSGAILTGVLADTIQEYPNQIPAKSPILFKTIMYHPIAKNYEFLVIKNCSDSAVSLYLSNDTFIPWKVTGINYDFNDSISLNSGDSIFLVEKAIFPEAFKLNLGLSSEVKVFTYTGKLDNSGENIAIKKPVVVKIGTTLYYAYTTLECIKYNDSSPWPESADGYGYALQRKSEDNFGNDWSNWSVKVFKAPVAILPNNKRVKINEPVNISGLNSYYVTGSKIEYHWKIISKPQGSNINLSNTSSSEIAIIPDIIGNYIIALQISSQGLTSEMAYTSITAIENHAPVAKTKKNFNSSIGNNLILDAGLSYDPDLDDISFDWEKVTAPDGSANNIADNDQVTAYYKPDVSGTHSLSLKVSDGKLTSTPVAINIVVKSTGINNLPAALSQLNVYPNPASVYMNLQFELIQATDVTISISDLQGRSLYAEPERILNAGMQNINISLTDKNLKPGLVVVKIKTNYFTSIQKVIIR